MRILAQAGRKGVFMADGNVSDKGPDPRYRRSSIWIDTSFQTRYLILIAGTTAAVILILGLLYANVLMEQEQLVGINAIAAGVELSDDDAAFDDSMTALMRSEDGSRLVALFASALVLVVLLSWVAVRMTFRVVGPVKAASTMLRKLKDGDDSGIRPFRNGDEFSFLANDILVLRDSMRDREAEAGELLGAAARNLSSGGGDAELVGRIRDFLGRQSSRFPKQEQEG